MAYDRYDNRRERDWRGSEPDRSSYERGRRDERGFWERAGDEVASWFGDDDAERRRSEDERMERDRGGSWSGMTSGGWSRDREDDRGFGRDFERDRARSRSMGWTPGERDARFSGPASGRSFGPDRNREPERGYRPMAGDYGRSSTREDRDSDRHYHSWRQRQMAELDSDYDRYNRERQDRFENDFGTWRQNRMSKRGHLGSIREHMDVVGSDGETIGKVDKVRGDHVILTKSDSPDNRHHAIDCSMIQSIEGDQIRLEMPAEEAKSRWEDSDGHSILSREWNRGRGRDRDEDVNLNRAFSGTYEDR